MANFSALAVGVTVGAAINSSYDRTLRAAGERAERLGQQWRDTNTRLKAVGDVIRYRDTLDTLRRKQADAGRTSDRLERGLRDVEQRYKAAKRVARTYGIEVGRAAVEHKRLTRELKATELAQRGLARRQAAGARLGRMRTSGLAAAGTAYGVGRVIGGAMDLEERAIHLGNVVGAPDQAAAVGRALRHARTFARDTLATEGELLDIQYQLGSAGLQEEAARVGTEIVHKLAKVTKGTPAEVGKIAATTYNNLAGSMEGAVGAKLARIGNVLARTQIRYQIENFGQLGESLSEGAAGAVAAKLPLEQLAAAVGQLNTAGQEGSEAGTALRAVLRNLTAASGELGTEVVRDAQGQLDLVATLEQVRDATAGLDTDARGDLLRKIFGDEGQAGIVPLLEKIDELKTGVEDLRAAGQSDLVNEKYERFLESASGKWTRLTQNVRQAGDAFGGALLPRLVAVLAPAAALAGWVGNAIVKYPAAAEVVGWLGVAFVGAAATLAVLTAGTWAYGAAETALSTVLRSRLLSMVAGRTVTLAHATATGTWTVATKAATAGQWLLNAALTANPIGLVVAGVAALVGGAVLLWKNWKPVMDWFLDVWEGLKGFVGGVAEKLGLVADETNSGGGARRNRRGRQGAVAGDAVEDGEVAARRVGAVPAVAVATVAAVAPAAGTAPAVFEAQAPAAIEVEAPPVPQVHPLAAFETPIAAPAPRPIHVEVHGGPVTIHAAGADAREIAIEVERHYETMLRRAAPRPRPSWLRTMPETVIGRPVRGSAVSGGGRVMMTLGPVAFGVATTAFQRLRRVTGFRWPALERVGRWPARQFTGPGQDQITLDGVIMPTYSGAVGSVESLRELALTGQPYQSVGGHGRGLRPVVPLAGRGRPVRAVRRRRAAPGRMGAPARPLRRRRAGRAAGHAGAGRRELRRPAARPEHDDPGRGRRSKPGGRGGCRA